MKRITVLALCVLLLGFSAWAEGQKEAEESTARAQKLTLWDTQTTSKLANAIETAAEQFTQDTGVELEVVHIQNDPYKTKLKVAMGGGSPPDIFHTWGGGPLKAYIDAGNVVRIDDIKDQLLERYIPSSFDPVTFDGKTYGAAYAGLTGVFFFYRTDIFDQYGLQVPETMEEFYQVADTLKENGITPIALANKTKWPGSFYYMYFADRLGGPDMFLDALYRNEGGTFMTEEYVEAGKMLQDLVERGYFPKGFNGMDYDTGQSRSLVYSGKAAMILMGTWFYGAANNEAPQVVDKLDIFRFPEVQGGDGNPTNLIGSPGQDYFAIASATEAPEQAKIFLTDYLMNDDYVEYMSTEVGYIPPVKNAASYVTEPLMQDVARFFEQAGHVQVYYDQFLPPALGELHKDLVQSLFGLDITPREVARRHEEAMKEEMEK